jgi:hypothetical protein
MLLDNKFQTKIEKNHATFLEKYWIYKKMNSITLILEDPIPFIKLIGIPDEKY